MVAIQDKLDDAAIGLKSTALLFGDNRRQILTGFAALSAASVCLAGYAADLSSPFYVGVGAGLAHMLWQVNTADWSDRVNLNQRFVSNNWVGALVLAGIVAGKLL